MKVITSIPDPSEYDKDQYVKTIDSQRDRSYSAACKAIDELYTLHQAEGKVVYGTVYGERIYIYHYGYRYIIFRSLNQKIKPEKQKNYGY